MEKTDETVVPEPKKKMFDRDKLIVTLTTAALTAVVTWTVKHSLDSLFDKDEDQVASAIPEIQEQ